MNAHDTAMELSHGSAIGGPMESPMALKLFYVCDMGVPWDSQESVTGRPWDAFHRNAMKTFM